MAAARHAVWALFGSVLGGGVSLVISQMRFPKSSARAVDDLEACVRVLEPISPLSPEAYTELVRGTERLVGLLEVIRNQREEATVQRMASEGLSAIREARGWLAALRDAVSDKGSGNAAIIRTMERGFEETMTELARMERLFFNYISRTF